MNSTEIIEALRQKMNVPSGRHLYGVLGSYTHLESFKKDLIQAKTLDGAQFPIPISVNRGILDTIPDDEFKKLAQDEAKYPEPTKSHIGRAFEHFLRDALGNDNIVILADIEMLFAYNIEMNLLRTLATDEKKLLLLLPGKRTVNRVVMFHEMEEGEYTLPTNLIADNHLWEISN